MRMLIRFELRKIWTKRLAMAAMLMLFLLDGSILLNLGERDIKGEQQEAARYAGELDDEKVQRMLEDYLPTQERLDMLRGISVGDVTFSPMQSAVHSRFADAQGRWNGKTVSQVFGTARIEVGYNAGWLRFSRQMIKLGVALLIAAMILTAPVFAGEYDGMESLILSSRCGRTRCVLAKASAALMVTTGMTAALLAVNAAAALALYGMQGLDAGVLFCPLEFEHYMKRSISCAQMLSWQAGLMLYGVFAATGVTLLVSALSRNVASALVLSMLALLFPVFLSCSVKTPAGQALALMPVGLIQFSELMSVGTDTPILAMAAVPISAAVGALASCLGCRCFAKRQKCGA